MATSTDEFYEWARSTRKEWEWEGKRALYSVAIRQQTSMYNNRVEEDFIVISAPLNLANVDRKVINKYFYEAIKKRLGYSSNDFVGLKNRAINNLLNSNDNAVGDKILKEFSVEYPEYLI